MLKFMAFIVFFFAASANAFDFSILKVETIHDNMAGQFRHGNADVGFITAVLYQVQVSTFSDSLGREVKKVYTQETRLQPPLPNFPSDTAMRNIIQRHARDSGLFQKGRTTLNRYIAKQNAIKIRDSEDLYGDLKDQEITE